MATCFHPLPESFLFHQSSYIGCGGAGCVSVPCRGLLYFIFENGICSDELRRVSVPCRGPFYFILSITIRIRTDICFRPLPGSFLFHRMTMTGLMNIWKKVSVPCRGLFYFITRLETVEKSVFKFPSPAGVFFISSMAVSWMNILILSFRPLPGAFLFHQSEAEAKLKELRVSVPCRGLFYFIYMMI